MGGICWRKGIGRKHVESVILEEVKFWRIVLINTTVRKRVRLEWRGIGHDLLEVVCPLVAFVV